MTGSTERWLFDLGNTRLKCARLGEDGRPGPVLAFGHADAQALHALEQVLPARGASACLASVASPALTGEVIERLRARFVLVSQARTPARFDGLQVAYSQPAKLGVDRFLAMLGARGRGAGPWLVAGVGTALTIDLIDADGHHLGGRIAPSPDLMRQALHAAAAQLPATGGAFAEFATDTADALASGCEGAAVALVERSLAQAHQRLGQVPGLLVHGGGGEALRGSLPMATHVEGLVLEGLAAWAANLPRAGR